MAPSSSTRSPWPVEQAGRIVARWRTTTATDTRSLAIGRIVFGLLILLLGWPRYAPMAGLPSVFFDPPWISLAALFNGYPAAWFLQLLDAAILISLVSLTLGLLTRLSTLLLLVAWLVGNSFLYSLGKIDHDILVPAVLFVMCFKDWGRHWSVDAWLRRKEGPQPNEATDLVLLAIFIATGFLSAGFGKLITWVDLDPMTGGFLGWLYQLYYVQGNTALLADAAVALRPLWLWEVADVTAVVFELSPFIALMQRRWWSLWIACAALFHAANLLLLNISFITYLPVYLVMIPWTRSDPRRRPAHNAPTGPPLLVIVLCLLFVGVQVLQPGPVNGALHPLLDLIGQRSLLGHFHLLLYGTLAFLAIRSALLRPDDDLAH